MKSLFILFFVLISCLAKAQYLFIKNNLEFVNVYDSTRKKVISKIKNERYYYCGEPINRNWIYFSDLDGFCKLSNFQTFSSLSNNIQKTIFNKTLTHFYKICQTGNVPHIDTTGNSTDTTYYPIWSEYYGNSVEPLLSEFITYYKKTKDTVTLMRIFEAVKCSPDGAFAESLTYLIGQCYDFDKRLLIRQVKRLKKRTAKKSVENHLTSSVFYYYMRKNSKKTSEEQYNLAEQERDKIENALK